MSPAVVVATGALTCGHGGTSVVTKAMTSSRLTVAAQGVLLAGSEAGVSFAAGTPPCLNTTTSNPPVAASCTTAAASSGTTTRLKVGGLGVVLSTATGSTTPAATPPKPPPSALTWTVDSAANSRLTVA